jgi:hypothetical protein
MHRLSREIRLLRVLPWQRIGGIEPRLPFGQRLTAVPTTLNPRYD